MLLYINIKRCLNIQIYQLFYYHKVSMKYKFNKILSGIFIFNHTNSLIAWTVQNILILQRKIQFNLGNISSLLHVKPGIPRDRKSQFSREIPNSRCGVGNLFLIFFLIIACHRMRKHENWNDPFLWNVKMYSES